jgi:hypothetical protein
MLVSAKGLERQALKGIGLGFAAGTAAALSGQCAFAASQEGEALEPEGARTLRELTTRLEHAPRRRGFKTVPMILNNPDQ